ncbi:MAG TPA: peptide chain release factor N(5)-glutamine methyltransferase [Candidatus Saccharimonadales bacterium]|nr:peptide chain release factor N(5)-glutamine methyltransferase [Candidatus Saccharimonadales bacterium]
MTIQQLLGQAESQLKIADVTSARLDSQLLLEHATSRHRSWLLAHAEEELPSDQVANYQALITKRSQRVPLVHLTNSREFYGMDFFVDENVLTPRIETETMVELAIKYAPESSRLIDIGTGCGAMALAVARQRPDLQIWAADLSAQALAVARRNASKHQLRVRFIQSDLFASVGRQTATPGSSKPGLFSTVIANLPYLSTDAQSELLPEVKREPAVALFGGPGDGLGLYRRFLVQLPRHLEPGGYLFTESDPWQQPQLTDEAAKIGLALIEQDYFILSFQKQTKTPFKEGLSQRPR